MSTRKPYASIDFPGGTAFSRRFPVDLNIESVAEVVREMPDALETGLLLRGSSLTEMTLFPGVSTSSAFGEINLLHATAEEILEFKSRLLLADDIAINGMTLVALQLTRDNGYLQDFSITAINGANPATNYVEVEGYRNESGTFEFAKSEMSPSHEMLSQEPLERTAVAAFIRSIRERSAAPEPATDAPVDELLAMLSVAPHRLVTRTGEYEFEESNVALSVDTARLTREGKKEDLVTFAINSKQTLVDEPDSKVSLMMGLKRGYDKRDRYRYSATIGMAMLDDKRPYERASKFEDLSEFYLKNPELFYATLGKVASDFSNALEIS